MSYAAHIDVTVMRCEGLSEAKKYYAMVYAHRTNIGRTQVAAPSTDPVFMRRITGEVTDEEILVTIVIFSPSGFLKRKDTPVCQAQIPLPAEDIREAMYVSHIYEKLPLLGLTSDDGLQGPQNGTIDVALRTGLEKSENPDRITPSLEAAPLIPRTLELNIISARGLTNNGKPFPENSHSIDAYAKVTAVLSTEGEEESDVFRLVKKTKAMRVKPREDDHEWDVRHSIPTHDVPLKDATLTLLVEVFERRRNKEDRSLGWINVAYSGAALASTLEKKMKKMVPIVSPNPDVELKGKQKDRKGRYGLICFVLRASGDDPEAACMTDTDRFDDPEEIQEAPSLTSASNSSSEEATDTASEVPTTTSRRSSMASVHTRSSQGNSTAKSEEPASSRASEVPVKKQQSRKLDAAVAKENLRVERLRRLHLMALVSSGAGPRLQSARGNDFFNRVARHDDVDGVKRGAGGGGGGGLFGRRIDNLSYQSGSAGRRGMHASELPHAIVPGGRGDKIRPVASI